MYRKLHNEITENSLTEGLYIDKRLNFLPHLYSYIFGKNIFPDQKRIFVPICFVRNIFARDLFFYPIFIVRNIFTQFFLCFTFVNRIFYLVFSLIFYFPYICVCVRVYICMYVYV